MKNLTNILQNGNLKAREKYILLIQNDIHKAKTGKEILTPADKNALENWRAKDNNEAREWNRLNEGWKYTGRMEIEAEFIYKDGQVAYLSQLPILFELSSYARYTKMEGCIRTLKKIKKVSIEEAFKISEMQKAVKIKDGLDFDYAVYKLAFELLKSEDKKQMEELYPDIEFDHQYLDQEEIIANLYNGKKELSTEAKEKLAELIAECSYNKFAKEYQLYHYFACIPVMEVARYFLKSKEIEIKDKSSDDDSDSYEDVTKAMEDYATEHGTTVQKMLKEACIKGLDGILEKHLPLVISNSADLLQRWLSSKAEATIILRKHIDSGELKIREHNEQETMRDKLYSKNLFDSEYEAARVIVENIGLNIETKGEIDERKAFETFDGAVITGENLYAFKENYAFVKDFKDRVDKYEPNLGIVYADNDPEQKGEHLDKELLVCSLNDNDGEASFFSLYGMSVTMLSNILDSKTFFEEVSEGGIKFLKFKDVEIEKAIKERREELINSFAKLLAFEGMFKRVAKIYEADLTYHIADRIRILREYMEYENEAFRQATNTSEKKSKKKIEIFSRKGILQMKESLIIDIDSIKPDFKHLVEHEEKLKGILGEF